MVQYGWDRGLDFGATRLKLSEMMKELRSQADESPNSIMRITHCSVLLIQLINGARISEAFDAMRFWTENGNYEQQVNVRKRGKVVNCLTCGGFYSLRSKEHGPKEHTELTGHAEFSQPYNRPEPRLMSIPKELTEEDRKIAEKGVQRGVTVNATKLFAIKVMGFNTHALRYAQITELARKGMAPQVIAKVTHHKTLTFILSYTQQKEADRALTDLAGEA